jgi:hypothetical protein
MKPKHLCRIGAWIVLSFLVLLLADTRAHARPSVLPTPEIDAGMVVSGVTLLIASTMVLVDRFRRR